MILSAVRVESDWLKPTSFLMLPDSEEGLMNEEMEFSFTSGTRQGCLQLTVTYK